MISFSSWRTSVHLVAQVADERLEHARRQLELHELVGELLADLERLRILRAHLLDVRERIRQILATAAKRRAASSGSGPVSTASSSSPRRRFPRSLRLRSFLRHRRREIHLGGVLRLRDDVRRVRVDEPDDDVDQARAAGLHRLVSAQQVFRRGRVVRKCEAHGVEAFLDALGDADFAFARQQLDRAHLAHVHAHRIGGAAEFGVERGQRGGGLLDGFFVSGRGRLGRENALVVRRLFVHRNAHVVDRVYDLFDLLGVDDFRRQVIVHLRVGEVALFLAARDQQLELRLTLFRQHVAARRKVDELGVALLALLAIGRRGAAAARAAASFCAALSSTTLPLAFAAGAATFSGALPLAAGFFTPTCLAACFAACAAFLGWAAAGFAAFFGSFFEAGAVGRLCFCVMSFRRPGRN